MAPWHFTDYGFMMPVGTPPNAIARSGHVSIKQMVVWSSFDLICIPLVTIMMVLLLHGLDMMEYLKIQKLKILQLLNLLKVS